MCFMLFVATTNHSRYEVHNSVELYGVWAGNWGKPARRVELLSISRMREGSSVLGEQVFYRVQL